MNGMFCHLHFSALPACGNILLVLMAEADLDYYLCRSRRANDLWYKTLYPKANGWYNGANIPGKRIEPMNWIGGMVAYVEALSKSLENNYQSWHTAKLDDKK